MSAEGLAFRASSGGPPSIEGAAGDLQFLADLVNSEPFIRLGLALGTTPELGEVPGPDPEFGAQFGHRALALSGTIDSGHDWFCLLLSEGCSGALPGRGVGTALGRGRVMPPDPARPEADGDVTGRASPLARPRDVIRRASRVGSPQAIPASVSRSATCS